LESGKLLVNVKWHTGEVWLLDATLVTSSGEVEESTLGSMSQEECEEHQQDLSGIYATCMIMMMVSMQPQLQDLPF